jgi:hypothetical protein
MVQMRMGCVTDYMVETHYLLQIILPLWNLYICTADGTLFLLFACTGKLFRLRACSWLILLCFFGYIANQRVSECKTRNVVLAGSMVVIAFLGTHFDMGSELAVPRVF